MKRRGIKKLLSESESIRKAINEGVPLKEAIRIYEEANRKTESGEWVELFRYKPKFSKSDEEYNIQSTSIARFWGPKEYLGGKERVSRNKLEKLYESGLIGKTHELLRGSDIYPQRYIKRGTKYEKEYYDQEKLTIPKIGSRVLHRHWEIKDMYKYKKRHRDNLDSMLIVIALFLVGSFSLMNSSSMSGYHILSINYPNGLIIPVITVIILLILIRKGFRFSR